jgi:hypothetical protein
VAVANVIQGEPADKQHAIRCENLQDDFSKPGYGAMEKDADYQG